MKDYQRNILGKIIHFTIDGTHITLHGEFSYPAFQQIARELKTTIPDNQYALLINETTTHEIKRFRPIKKGQIRFVMWEELYPFLTIDVQNTLWWTTAENKKLVYKPLYKNAAELAAIHIFVIDI